MAERADTAHMKSVIASRKAASPGLISIGKAVCSLKYVAKVSDDYDDELQSLGGGQRAEDVLREG